MDFDSPDVEKDFPGLYASENARKNQSRDSDFSDDEKTSRKDLLGKKREKRESKKDKGYVAFEGESSDDDVDETRSPGKGKKSKSSTFKFPGKDKKEKHHKAKDRDTKEKKDEREKEKICKKESKEMKKEVKDLDKVKDKSKPKKKKESKILRIKDRKKKSVDQGVADEEEKPIFGVPLQVAVERSKSHDGMELPVVVRECIDYIEEHGLACEGIYRISGLKSKLRQLKSQYNRREKVYLYEHEPHIVASLLKQFLRELPEPILTTELAPEFEEAAAVKNEKKRAETLQKLLNELPNCNRLLLSWIFVHMLHVISLEKRNKMNLQNVSIVLSPTLQISHHVLQALFAHSHILFKGVEIKKYVPPLELDSSRLSLELPDSPTAIAEELSRQENVLNILHAELNTGLRDKQKEEQLWEIQRVVTQLKRKLRFLRQVQEASVPITDEIKNNSSKSEEFVPVSITHQPTDDDVTSDSVIKAKPVVSEKDNALDKVESDSEDKKVVTETTVKSEDAIQSYVIQDAEIEGTVKNFTSLEVTDEESTISVGVDMSCENENSQVEMTENFAPLHQSSQPEMLHKSEDEQVYDILLQEEKMLQIQYEELMLLGDELKRKINSEKMEIERLQTEINEVQQLYKYKRYSFDSTDNSSSDSDDSSASECDDEEDLPNVLEELIKENKALEEKNSDLSKVIQHEREVCLNIKVQMKMLQCDSKYMR